MTAPLGQAGGYTNKGGRQSGRENFAVHGRKKERAMANTKTIEDTEERKKVKRAARKAAAPKGPRTGACGSNKQKVKTLARGTSKRK